MAPLDFPVSVGTFTMAGCRVCNAINAFYAQHQFPRPQPGNPEPSMVGVDPYACGLSQGEIIFSQLSPLHEVTLDDESKAAAGINAEARYFAWAYPAVEAAEQSGSSAEHAFIKFGGYVYFDRESRALQTNGIAPAPLGTLGLTFGRAQILPQGAVETLQRQGRFQEISLEPLLVAGAEVFAWVRPGEFADTVAAPDGAFAYRFRAGPPRYYPVVKTPVFLPEMLAESLDEGEAWVVVRPPHPTLEKVVMFDKASDFNSNVRDQSEIAGLVTADDEEVTCSREGRPDERLPYAQWKTSTEQGTIGEPWILTVTPRLAFGGNDVVQG